MNPLEAIYHRLYRRRMAAALGRRAALHTAIISVGNITTGGTGKTPAVQWLARLLQSRGKAVAVVGRGYGGRLSGAGAVVSDGSETLLSAAEAGDEALLHARCLLGVPVLIGRDRVAACRQAESLFHPDVIVLDDGFQYWSLARDLDLVLLDAARPLGNGRLLPSGRLREPAQALRRASAVLFTRSDEAGAEQLEGGGAMVSTWTDAPQFASRHQPAGLCYEPAGEALPLRALEGMPVLALSALADNRQFQQTLTRLGARVEDVVERGDHHRWTRQELQRAVAAATAAGAAAILTTEKDAVKIGRWTHRLPLLSLSIELAPTDVGLERFILGALEASELSHKHGC